MIPLTEFMQLNQPIILFVYGLVYFTLGITVALQSRSYSRLQLARSLKWLAVFGIVHGIHEWGDLFIPLQASNMSANTLIFLTIIQLLTLAVSFTSLLAFGISLLLPINYGRRLMGIPLLVLATWAIFSFLITLRIIPDLVVWRNTSNAVARYFIAIPGGILAAYSLRRHAIQRIEPLNAPHITRNLRMAGFAFLFYALFAGFIVPPVPFFPGNVINTITFTETFGFPPIIIRSFIGLVLAVFIIRALEIFDLEHVRQIESMEQQQILAVERQRIARELHDGSIQSAYTAGLLVESASRIAEPGSELKHRLDRALSALEVAVNDMRRNLDDLQMSSTEVPLKSSIEELIADPRYTTLFEIQSQFDFPDCQSMKSNRLDHVIYIVQEALTNVIRHADAHTVMINASDSDNRLLLTICDDGHGMSGSLREGYGLRNMRDRARLLGGEFYIDGSKTGTSVTLNVPWNEEV